MFVLRNILIIKANGLASVDQNLNISVINIYTISIYQLGYGNSQPQDKTSVVGENLVKLCPLLLQKKCDQYWPKEGSEHYGLIQVRLVHEEVLATYTIRKFAIRHMKVCMNYIIVNTAISDDKYDRRVLDSGEQWLSVFVYI